jgi:hypothetical protein
VAKADGRPEFGTAALKRECRQVDASPITFADVLPICLSNKNSSSVKLRERSAIASTLIDEHIDGILSLDLFARVSLVVLSGHERSEFTYATEVFQSRLDAKGVPHITTAFLYPTNSSKIRSVIEETGTIGRFQSILRKFRNAF